MGGGSKLYYKSIIVAASTVKNKKNKSYVGDNNSCVGVSNLYITLSISHIVYIEDNLSYIGDNMSPVRGYGIISYVGDKK